MRYVELRCTNGAYTRLQITGNELPDILLYDSRYYKQTVYQHDLYQEYIEVTFRSLTNTWDYRNFESVEHPMYRMYKEIDMELNQDKPREVAK